VLALRFILAGSGPAAAAGGAAAAAQGRAQAGQGEQIMISLFFLGSVVHVSNQQFQLRVHCLNCLHLLSCYVLSVAQGKDAAAWHGVVPVCQASSCDACQASDIIGISLSLRVE
jgi:hypothetical protein